MQIGANSLKAVTNYQAPAPAIARETPAANQDSYTAGERSNWQPAIETMKGLTFAPKTTEFKSLAQEVTASQQPDGSWGNNDANVINHVAVTSLLRDFTFASDSPSADAATEAQLKATLAKSWKNLTGKVPASDDSLLNALPSKVLAKSGPAANGFHEAMLGTSVAVRVSPEAVLEKALQSAQASDQTPVRKGLSGWAVAGLAAAGTAAATAVASALNPAVGHMVAATGAVAIPQAFQFVAGVASGWANASFMESFIHDRVAHADKDSMKVWKQMGPVGKAFQETYIGHSIHHNATFKTSHVRQFDSEEEKVKLTEKLVAKGRQGLVDSQYGASLGWDGYASFQAVASPIYAATLGTAAMMGAGPAYFIGHAIPALSYPLFSKIVHPNMHKTAKEIVETTPNPLKALMTSKPVRFITAYHFVHHERDRELQSPAGKVELKGTKLGLLQDIRSVLKRPTGSVNLNLFLGADWLRNTVELPNWRDIKKMRDERMLY